MLPSIFPGMSESDGLRELEPGSSEASSGGGGGGSTKPSTAPPILLVCGGRLAGWLTTATPTPAPAPAPKTDCGNLKHFASGEASSISSKKSCTALLPGATISNNSNNSRMNHGSNSNSGSSSNGSSMDHKSCAVEGIYGSEIREPPPSSPHCNGNGNGNRSFFGGAQGFVLSKDVSRGDIVAVERPLEAVQTSEALPWVVACPGCLRHVGSLELQLAIASGEAGRAEAFLGNFTASKASPPVQGGGGVEEECGGEEKREGGSKGGRGERQGRGEGGAGRGGSREEGDADGGGAVEEESGNVYREKTRLEGGRGGEKERPGGAGLLPALKGLSERFAEVRGGCSFVSSQNGAQLLLFWVSHSAGC